MKLPVLAGLAVLLTASLSVHTAEAQAISLHARTAGELADMCGADPRSATGPAKLNYCSGFAQGAVDVELRHAGPNKPFCIPPNVKREVTLREFANWVRGIPAHASLDSAAGLFQYLTERYPCK